MDQFLSLFIILIILFREIVTHEIAGNLREKYLANDVKCTSFCSSPHCTNEIFHVIKYMDKMVDPCSDFYQFVCGNLKHRIRLESFSEIDFAKSKLYEQMSNELKSDISSTDLVAFKKMKMYYKSCLDEAEIEKIGTIPLLKLLKILGGWPVLLGDEWKEENYHWTEVLSTISKEGFDPGFPFELTVVIDHTNSQNYSLQISPPRTNFNNATSKKFIENYKSYLIKLAVLLGAKKEKVIEEINECVNFEETLFKAQSSLLSVRHFSPIKNKKTISELSDKYPDIPWLDVINKILHSSNISVTTKESLIVWDSKFLSEIGQIMKNTSRRTIANYQILRVVDGLVGFMPDKFRKQKLNLLKIMYNGQYSMQRDVFCFSLVKIYFGKALSSLYLKKYFNVQSKDKISGVVQSILQETKTVLEHTRWIDNHTRRKALVKLEAMKVVAAYPDDLLDDKKVESYYENVQITPGKFFNNIQEIAINVRNMIFKRLEKPVEIFFEIGQDVTDLNLFYFYQKNQINVLAAMLQKPFFEVSWPDYMNYGTIGYMIGHEITHGFDNTGRKYDRNGNYRNWWNNNTARVFNHKVQCMIDQYNNYTIKQINQPVHGKLTIDENIADAGGIKLAYHAFQKSLKNKDAGKQCIPGLNYTLNQMFWISAASTWCGICTNQALQTFMALDPHSPNEARVNVPFSNTDDFATDFQCPIGSIMNPMKKCEVW